MLHMRTAKNRSRGFTLVELLVAVTLAMILSGSIAFVAMQTQRIYSESVAKVDLYARLRYAFSLMENELSRMVPTCDLEFFRDQKAHASRSNNHWDPGEEVKTALNLAGGWGPDTFYNEAPQVVERYYTRQYRRKPPEEHAAFEIYFRAPVRLGGHVILANVEYRLVRAADLVKLPRATGKLAYTRIDLPEVRKVDQDEELSLVRIVRYMEQGLGIVTNAMWTRLVRTHISEISSNVVDFKVEYYARNPYGRTARGGGRGAKAGWFTPQLDRGRNAVELKSPAVEVKGRNVFLKEFIYGTSRLKPPFGGQPPNGILRRAIKMDPRNPRGRSVPTEFQVPQLKFAELAIGDKIYIWRDTRGDYFDGGEFTIQNIVNGRLRFLEPLDTSSWRGDKTGLRFKAAYLPMALRLTLILASRRGDRQHEITRIVRLAAKPSA